MTYKILKNKNKKHLKEPKQLKIYFNLPPQTFFFEKTGFPQSWKTCIYEEAYFFFKTQQLQNLHKNILLARNSKMIKSYNM